MVNYINTKEVVITTKRKYASQNVYDALQNRFHYIFKEFDNIFVSFSGGKDSGLLLNLTLDFQKKFYPDKKIGIVCEPVNEKGVLRVQLQDKKIYINHKRVRLHVAAEKLYPADYDFSIIFDSVETRKTRHQMERKYVDALLNLSEE